MKGALMEGVKRPKNQLKFRIMAKSQDAKKTEKKTPAKTPKEKKEAKREKKAGKK